MFQLTSNPWEVAEADFPAAGTPVDKLRFLLNYAVLAPSRHNVQPWLFRVHNATVDLYVDRSRALPVVDARDRELIISCGSALANFLIAIRHFGYAANVEIHSHPEQPDLLAHVTLEHGIEASEEEQQMFQAMLQRRTNRQPFADRPLPPSLLAALERLAMQEAARFQVVEEKEVRRALLDLIATADGMLWTDPHFRDEVAHWTRPPGSTSHDGVPDSAIGRVHMASYLGARTAHTFLVEEGKTHREAQASPALAVLWTPGDTWFDWLAAGRALERILLYARANDVWASFLNQPLALPALRTAVGDLFKEAESPQLILRMGYGSPVAPTPRRSVNEVLI
jgi:hypothetical protein